MSSMSASAVTVFVPARPRTRPTSTVQLTRRGRLVVFLAAFLLVLTVAFLLGAAAVGTSDAPPAPQGPLSGATYRSSAPGRNGRPATQG